MYFVSKNPRLKLVVRADETEYIHQTNGQTRTITHSPVVYAEFEPDRSIPYEFRRFAVSYFSDPSQVGTQWQAAGITGLGQAEGGVFGDGTVYQAHDPLDRLGILDTDNTSHVPEEFAALVKDYLLTSPHLGQRYIHFDTRLPAPWASYAKLSGPGVVAKIIGRIEDDELDANYVLTFERENANRHAVVTALEEFLARG